MAIKHRPLVIGNWKMNPQSAKAAKTLFQDIQRSVVRIRGVDVAVAPPSIYLSDLAAIAKGKRMPLAAQDAFWEKLGSRTGEISVTMVKGIGATYVILGHSERRALGETDGIVNKKTLAVLKEGMSAVVCVGEETRDAHANYLSLIETQVRSALAGVTKTQLERLIIAYEPIWAIGTGVNATPHDAHEMKLFIQRILTDLYGRAPMASVRILYGGSVTGRNAEALLHDGEVDGFLVGGSSLRAAEFTQIIKHAASA